MIVQARNEHEFVAAVGKEGLFSSDANLFDGFQAVYGEGGTNDH